MQSGNLLHISRMDKKLPDKLLRFCRYENACRSIGKSDNIYQSNVSVFFHYSYFFYMFINHFLGLYTDTFLINMLLPEHILKSAQFQMKIKVPLYIHYIIVPNMFLKTRFYIRRTLQSLLSKTIFK